MEKRYISFDIEASGPTPGKYSMLSLGACVVGDISKQFYREIKPISHNFIFEAMVISSKGLLCLKDLRHLEEFNPESKKFRPEEVLSILNERGEWPERVMEDYANWINEVTNGYKPVEAAAPIKFDGMFTAWYFDNFYNKKNPFGHSGEDINSMCRGVMKNINEKIENLRIRGNGIPHNALEDAIIQAKEFEIILEMMRR